MDPAVAAAASEVAGLSAAVGKVGSSSREAAPKALYKLLQFSKHLATFMTDPSPRFGFVAFAETWNGRLAMLGFVIGLGTELLTGQGILSQIGLG
jgi:hypothetical protein